MNGNLVLAVWQMLRQILYSMKANCEIFSNPVLRAPLIGRILLLTFVTSGAHLPKEAYFCMLFISEKGAVVVIQSSLIQKSET